MSKAKHFHTMNPALLPLPQIEVVFRGPDPLRKSIVTIVTKMLEDFKLFGTFTVHNVHQDRSSSNPQKHGIRIRHHTTTGVRLDIQASTDRNDSYEAYLIWKNHGHSELFDRLIRKVGTQRGYYPEKWVDPDGQERLREIIPAQPPPSEPSPPPEESQPTVVSFTENGGPQQKSSLQGYSTDAFLIAIILDQVYTKHGQRSFSLDDFYRIVRENCPGAFEPHMAQILKRYVDKGFVEKRELGAVREYSVTDTALQFMERRTGKQYERIAAQAVVSRSPAKPDERDREAKVLFGALEKVRRYDAAKSAVDLKTRQHRITTAQIRELEKTLRELEAEIAEAEKAMNAPDVLQALKFVATIMGPPADQKKP